MTRSDFNTTILVDQTPEQVFNAVNNPRAWWSEEIVGETDKLNAVFDYHFEDIHRCRIQLVEMVPNKKVVWLVLENYFKPGIFDDGTTHPKNNKFTDNEAEWTDTTIHFELSEKDGKTQLQFLHLGLIPEYECFDVCVNAWTHYVRESLYGLITTGKGQPNSTDKPMTEDEERFKTAGGND